MMPPARASRQHSEARRFGEGMRTDSSVLVGSASPARAASQPPRGGGAASGGGRRERSGRRQRERARRAAEAAASQAALAARAVSSAATREGPNEAVSHRRRSRCRQPTEGGLCPRRASREPPPAAAADPCGSEARLGQLWTAAEAWGGVQPSIAACHGAAPGGWGATAPRWRLSGPSSSSAPPGSRRGENPAPVRGSPEGPSASPSEPPRPSAMPGGATRPRRPRRSTQPSICVVGLLDAGTSGEAVPARPQSPLEAAAAAISSGDHPTPAGAR